MAEHEGRLWLSCVVFGSLFVFIVCLAVSSVAYRSHQRNRPPRVASFVVAYAALVYVFIATATFRFRHPWMTDTQLLIHVGDALMWRDVPPEVR